MKPESGRDTVRGRLGDRVGRDTFYDTARTHIILCFCLEGEHVSYSALLVDVIFLQHSFMKPIRMRNSGYWVGHSLQRSRNGDDLLNTAS